MTAEDITIELRLNKVESKIKAFADVTISLGECGNLTIYGFSVVGDAPRIVPPARKGDQRYFDVVLLTGKLRSLVYTLVGMEYKAALEKTTKGVA